MTHPALADTPCTSCGSHQHGTGGHSKLERLYAETEVVLLGDLEPYSVGIEETTVKIGPGVSIHGPAVVRKWKLKDGSTRVAVFLDYSP